MFLLSEICSHLTNRAFLTLSLDCDNYAFTKGFVIVWFCYTHCLSLKLLEDCSDCQWVACGTCACGALLGCKIIKVKMADITPCLIQI